MRSHRWLQRHSCVFSCDFCRCLSRCSRLWGLFIAVGFWNDYYSYMMYIANKPKLQLRVGAAPCADGYIHDVAVASAAHYLWGHSFHHRCASHGHYHLCDVTHHVRISVPAKAFCKRCADWRGERVKRETFQRRQTDGQSGRESLDHK